MEKNLKEKIFKISLLKGRFLLRSGKTSTEYFDKYRFSARPDLLKSVAHAMVPLLPKEYDLLGAMEMGGIPIATAISLETKTPLVFIRKEAKTYGTCRLAEGPAVKGRKICLIEDVITTGGQVVLSTEQLRKEGAIVTDVLSVIDRSLGDHSKLNTAKLKLSSLFRM